MKLKSLELDLEMDQLTKRGLVTTLSSEDIAYIAGLFDGEGLYILNVVPKRKRNIKVKVIVHLIV